MNQLVRYQVYLEPQLVAVADDIARRRRSSRAKVLREALAGYIKKERRISLGKNRGRNPLLDLVGIEKSKTGTIGLNVDEIYLHD